MPHAIRTLYVVHHSHTDIGYTDLQERVVQAQADYIRSALRILAEPQNAAFRWNCETWFCVEQFLQQATPEETEAFFARMKGLPVNRIAVGVTGVFFPPAAWLGFVAMYASFGISMVISLLAIVWVADIMAYFTGMAFGKHRMCPAISPKKSWEGVAGGMLSVMVLGLIFALCLPEVKTIPGVLTESMGVAAWIVVAFVLVSLSIVGDLFESALKRQAGIKDSSNLLPGHGGFYDRLDAMMPTLPAGFLLTVLVASGTIGF